MFVPSYQMHNVLNVYSQQLRHSLSSANRKKAPQSLPADQVSLTAEGKRKATIEKVSKDILERITRFGGYGGADQRATEHAKAEASKEPATEEAKAKTFEFNVIDTVNQKTRNTLSVEDSSFLIKRLEQLSKETRDKKTESWV